jgi:hypothetical protein
MADKRVIPRPAAVLMVLLAGCSGGVPEDRIRASSLLVGNRMVEVTLGPPTITLHEGGRATVTLSALVIGGAHLPERGQHLAIRSGWRLEDGDWKVYVAEWE